MICLAARDPLQALDAAVARLEDALQGVQPPGQTAEQCGRHVMSLGALWQWACYVSKLVAYCKAHLGEDCQAIPSPPPLDAIESGIRAAAARCGLPIALGRWDESDRLDGLPRAAGASTARVPALECLAFRIECVEGAAAAVVGVLVEEGQSDSARALELMCEALSLASRALREEAARASRPGAAEVEGLIEQILHAALSAIAAALDEDASMVAKHADVCTAAVRAVR